MLATKLWGYQIISHQIDKLPNFQVAKFSSYQIVSYQIVSYQIERLRNCQVTELLVTKLWGYQIISYQIVSYQNVSYQMSANIKEWMRVQAFYIFWTKLKVLYLNLVKGSKG